MTVRLAGLARSNWAMVDGFALARGMDVTVLELDRFCNYVWWFFTRNAQHADIEKFRAKVWRPPPRTVEIDKRSPWSAENETKAFAALKAQLAPK